MYVNSPRVNLKLEYHSSSGKDASTISNQKKWAYIHTSRESGGFRQLKIARSSPYCRRFDSLNSGAREDLVIVPNLRKAFLLIIELLYVYVLNLPFYF